VTAALPCPWVVLSQGVDAQRFPAAVEAACRGGAAGFLAGRAIWTDAIRPDRDTEAALREVSVPRLIDLGALVDRVADRSRVAAAGR
jgi:sulfofructosephosphate aldolase